MFNKIDNSIIDGKYQDRIDGLSKKISIALTNKDISSKSNKKFKKFLKVIKNKIPRHNLSKLNVNLLL